MNNFTFNKFACFLVKIRNLLKSLLSNLFIKLIKTFEIYNQIKIKNKNIETAKGKKIRVKLIRISDINKLELFIIIFN